MNRRWPAYTAALLLTVLLAVGTAYLPRLLLIRQERGILDTVHTISGGNYYSRPYPVVTPAQPPATATPTGAAPTPQAVPTADIAQLDYKRLVDRVRMSEDYRATVKQLTEPDEDEMDMRTAIITCRRRLMDLMKSGAILPLTNFPDGYTVNASLSSLSDSSGAQPFDYWSISFSVTNPKQKAQGSVGVMMDAVTGNIYSLKMTTNADVRAFRLETAAGAFAGSLGLDGSLTILPKEQSEAGEALWVTGDKGLFILFYYSQGTDVAAFAMSISTKKPG